MAEQGLAKSDCELAAKGLTTQFDALMKCDIKNAETLLLEREMVDPCSLRVQVSKKRVRFILEDLQGIINP